MLRRKLDVDCGLLPPLQRKLQRRGSRLCKIYDYPYAQDLTAVRERMLAWMEFSHHSRIIPTLTLGMSVLTAEGLRVEVEQELCHRVPHRIGETMRAELDELGEELRRAWSLGLVHGDLNRKNIWLTRSGYRLVDIEPLLKIPLANGGVHLRTTLPYLARCDRDHQTVTTASDRLGFACFQAWVRGDVERPAHAVAMFATETLA